MTDVKRWTIYMIMLSMIILSVPAVAQSAPYGPVTDPQDRVILDHFLQYTRRLPQIISRQYAIDLTAEEAEGIAWKVVPFLEMPRVAYLLTGDEQYLDLFVQTFENLKAALSTGTDGFLGWYGKALPIFQNPANPNLKVDVMITDFRIVKVLSEFLELTDHSPTLSARFAGQRSEYLALMQDHLVRKWDVRGNYVDLGNGAAIYRTRPDLKVDKANLTQPANKHAIIVKGLLALYRLSGNREYMDKAVKLGTRFKQTLTLRNGRYEWNYWDPAGPWDRDPNNPSRWKHWIGPEHRGGYFAETISMAASLYHHGVVFDDEDIRRFVRTQMEVAWNGSTVNPVYSRVNGTTSPLSGEYLASSLSPWAPELAAFLYEGTRQADRAAAATRSSWQGGALSREWLEMKHIVLPDYASRGRLYLSYGQQFLSGEPAPVPPADDNTAQPSEPDQQPEEPSPGQGEGRTPPSPPKGLRVRSR